MLTTELTAVSVVVPAYQEAPSIGAALIRLAEVLDGTGRPYEIVVVSDGSTDGTADRARELGLPHVTVLEYFPNQGKGHAIRYGFQHSSNPLVAFLDGDMDLHPSVLPGFFDRIDADSADVVVGSKVHPDSAVTYPLVRRVASRAWRRLTRTALGVDLGDTQTGVKAMRRSIAAPVMANLRVSGFAFDLEMLCWMVERGARVEEAPVVLDYEFTSRIDAGSVWQALLDVRTVAAHRRERQRVAALAPLRPAAHELAAVEPVVTVDAVAPVVPLLIPSARTERARELRPRPSFRPAGRKPAPDVEVSPAMSLVLPSARTESADELLPRASTR